MTEVTDRKTQREKIAAGGWTTAWGDLISEADIVELVISNVIPISAVDVWVYEQVEVQLRNFSQSLKDVSGDVVNQATDYLEGLLKRKASGETRRCTGFTANSCREILIWAVGPVVTDSVALGHMDLLLLLILGTWMGMLVLEALSR